MLLQNIKYAVLCAIVFRFVDASVSNLSRHKLSDNPDCDCYQRPYTYSCHCREKIHIYLREGIYIHTHLVCDDDTVSNPYKFLSQLTVRYNHSIILAVIGCPPPEKGYSAELPWGTFHEEGHENNSLAGLYLDCGGLNNWQLKSHHLQHFGNLGSLLISCPALSYIPGNILSGSSKDTYMLAIGNTIIEEIPDEVLPSLSNLKYLSLVDNKLKAIPSLKCLRLLEHFDMTGNNVNRLEEDIFLPTMYLSIIILNRNNLSSLPESLCELPLLEILEASNNRIEILNVSCFLQYAFIERVKLNLNFFFTLEYLPTTGNAQSTAEIIPRPLRSSHLQSSFYSSVNGIIPKRGNWRTIHYALMMKPFYADFIHIPPYIQSSFNFSNNGLISIHVNTFSGMKYLVDVDLSFNRLSFLPPSLFRSNPLLKRLKLSNNLISNILETFLIKNLKLQTLDISNNNISTLGENFFSELLFLRSINLSYNRIEYLPKGIFLPLNKSIFWFSLNLEGNLLTSLPTLSLPRLVDLNLARNRLENLSPDSLENLNSLLRINLSYNYIQTTDPPSSLGVGMGAGLFGSNLSNLRSIDLSHNKLTSYPNVTLVSKTLLYLYLSSNDIDELPLQRHYGIHLDTIDPNMQILDLSNNSLCHVFNTKGRERSLFNTLSYLVYLDLSWNGITIEECSEYHHDHTLWRCDSVLRGVNRLQVLILAHNEIEVIPYFFSELPKLRRADFSYNKIKVVSHINFFYTKGVYQIPSFNSEKSYVRKGDLYVLPNSHHLEIDLRHNEITLVDLPEEKVISVPQKFNTDAYFAPATILLGHNPIDCGCQIFRLLQYAEREIRPVAENERWRGSRHRMPATLDIQDLSCWEPISMRGKNVSDPETWMHHLLPLLGLCKHAGVLENPPPQRNGVYLDVQEAINMVHRYSLMITSVAIELYISDDHEDMNIITYA